MTLSSENVYISIFFSEKPLGPIETKHDRNVHWIILYSMFFFLFLSEIYRNKSPQGDKKCCFLFLYVEGLFSNQLWWRFSLYVPYKILLKYANIFYLDLNLFKI